MSQGINFPIKRVAMEADFNKVLHQSAPMNVPAWPRGWQNLSWELGEQNDADKNDFVAEMIPLHVIVPRSHAMTFLVFEGVGRTLKGRDLRWTLLKPRNRSLWSSGSLEMGDLTLTALRRMSRTKVSGK
ncbi:hypothetical protein KSP40_PGU008848 [Platanthera guangdongensis]|uniref:Uncharacterized protein n=1 Tax=Platanthera guangdongensis TaxID=2320717 RepID=A0ABR2MQQ2_9ASPA